MIEVYSRGGFVASSAIAAKPAEPQPKPAEASPQFDEAAVGEFEGSTTALVRSLPSMKFPQQLKKSKKQVRLVLSERLQTP